ncbi:hypothetical protein V6N13_142764 [Hibiscus sabdariffa]
MGFENSRDFSLGAGHGVAPADVTESAGTRSEHTEIITTNSSQEIIATNGSQEVVAANGSKSVDVSSPLIHDLSIKACPDNSNVSPGVSQSYQVSPATAPAAPYSPTTSIAGPSALVPPLNHSLEPNDVSLEGVGSLSTADLVFNTTSPAKLV